MTPQLWQAVDEYFMGALGADDEALAAAQRDAAAAGLPAISVSAAQGKLLNLLVRVAGARTILEVGTLGGYSTIWMARALPAGGRLVTLEVDPAHAKVAQANIERAGVADKVEIRVGRAADSLPVLHSEGWGPADLAFIDADKPSNAVYLDWALELSRPGTVIVVDNVARGGRVVEAPEDPAAQGVRKLVDAINGDPRLDATAIQTVGAKGYDGFLMAVVKDIEG